MALGSPQAARRAAQSILAEGRFHQAHIPDPLRGVLEAVGRVLSGPLDAVGRLAGRIAGSFPGGITGVWAVGAFLLILAVLILARRRARSRIASAAGAPTGGPRRLPTAAELERDAAAAEQAGRFDDAVRLRFRAGIMRLGQQLELRSPETVPNHAITGLIASRPLDGDVSNRFDALASRFDEVVYGGAAATATDAERQRREWPRLLTDAGGG